MRNKNMGHTNLFAEALSTTEAAHRFQVSQRYITFLARKGAIAAKKLGRDWLIDEASLNTYLSTPHKPGPKPKAKN
jgi:excisionase family DNA binding protein